MKHRIVLASSSPRRKSLLSNFVEDLAVVGSPYEEQLDPDGNPEVEVMRAALMKGLAAADRISPGEVLLAADTIVYLDRILGKPKDPDDAKRMLQDLSGRWHSVYTGIALVAPERNLKVVDYVRTAVRFNPLDASLIDWYVASGEPLDKAGAYGIQDLGALLVAEIRGDYFNVVGLPLSRVHVLLMRHFGKGLY